MEPLAVLGMLRLDETIAVLHQMLAAFVDLGTMQKWTQDSPHGSRAPLMKMFSEGDQDQVQLSCSKIIETLSTFPKDC